jgi:hypothetical protein
MRFSARTRLLHAERRDRGTLRRSTALTCCGQAVFALCWFRESRDIPTLARDHGISHASGYRYLAVAIEVLATQVPDLYPYQRRGRPSRRGRITRPSGIPRSRPVRCCVMLLAGRRCSAVWSRTR